MEDGVLVGNSVSNFSSATGEIVTGDPSASGKDSGFDLKMSGTLVDAAVHMRSEAPASLHDSSADVNETSLHVEVELKSDREYSIKGLKTTVTPSSGGAGALEDLVC